MPDLWDDPQRSQEMMRDLKYLKSDLETYRELEGQMEDMETLLEMGYEEEDPDVIPELEEMLQEIGRAHV